MIIGYTEINESAIQNVSNNYFANRIKEYSRTQEKVRTYASYVLLKKLTKKYKIDLDQVDIVRDRNGKPYAKNNEFCFNIAHSGNMVVVAIDDKRVGIDIEYIRPFDVRIAKKFFSDKIDKISNAVEPGIEFTKQWTIFEAGLKYYGSIELLRQNPVPTMFCKNLFDSEKTQYILTVATDEKIEKDIIIEKF